MLMKMDELKKENEELRKELEAARNSKLIKKLIKNLEDIKKGNYITRKGLGL